MDELPLDLQHMILNQLPVTDLKNMYQVNKHFNTVCSDIKPSFQHLYSTYVKTGKLKHPPEGPINQRLLQSEYYDPEDISSLTLKNRDKKTLYTLLMEDQSKIKVSKVTHEQQDIVDSIHNYDEDAIVVVQAYAGTGKTTTLKYCCENWSNKTILVFAFNKSATKLLNELFAECPHVTVKGFHQLAYHNIPDIKCCDKLKVSMLREFFSNNNLSHEELQHIKKSFELFCYSKDNFADNPKVQQIFNAMINGDLPYTHDAYLKKYQLECTDLDYDVVMVDESQDCNDCMASIVMKQENSFRLFVGDIYQNIYSFRNGEHNKIMRNLYFQSTEVIKKYLSISFRYSGVFGMMVNEFLKTKLKAVKNVVTIGTNETTIHEFEKYSDLPVGTTIVCKHNKTIFTLMFELSQNNKTFMIIRNNKEIDFDEEIQILKDLYHLYRHELDQIEHPKLKTFDDIYQVGINNRNNNKWDQRCDIFTRHPEDCWVKAKAMYVKDNPDYIITNTHQAKGMEFDNVAVSSEFNFVNEDALNIFYTAVTRVKKRFYVMKDVYKTEFLKPHLFL